jgi:hypothetical protein
MSTRIALLACSVLLMMATAAHAQFDAVINAPPIVIGDHESIGSNTQVNVFDGGSIGPYFEAGVEGASSENIEVNVFGGFVDHSFTAYDGSQVTIFGGSVGENLTAYTGSQVTIAGGWVDDEFGARSGSQVTITGGSVGWNDDAFTARAGSQVTISGGALGPAFRMRDGSQVTITGGEFYLDGVPIEGLGSVGSSMAIDVPEDAVLSGVLADGTPFAFSSMDADLIARGTLTLVSSSLPPVGPALITASTDPIPLGIRQGQTLVVDDGGVVADNFHVGAGGTVTIEEGGVVGRSLEAIGAEVTVSGGSVGNEFSAFRGSEVMISGGVVGRYFIAVDGSQVIISGGVVEGSFGVNGSQVTISGGVVGADFWARESSRVIISGGVVGNRFEAQHGSQVTISGGLLGDNFHAHEGSQVTVSGGLLGKAFHAREGSHISFVGTEFLVDGEVITDLTVGEQITLVNRDVTLSGFLADHTPFSVELNSNVDYLSDHFSPDATLTLTLVPEPSSIVLAVAALVLMVGDFRKRFGR